MNTIKNIAHDYYFYIFTPFIFVCIVLRLNRRVRARVRSLSVDSSVVVCKWARFFVRMNWRVAAGLPSSPFAAMRTMAHSRTFVWGLSRSTSKRIYNATKCPHCQLINICFYLFFLLIFSHFGFIQQRIAFFPMQKSLFFQMWMVDGMRDHSQ